MNGSNFITALAQHDKEIISLIDEMIRQSNTKRQKISYTDAVFAGRPDWNIEIGYKQALTELKNKLEGKL
jgi:hypothetical protein